MGVTLSFQSSGAMPGSAAPVTMQGGSLTVGRGPANDIVLPDPDRVLSKSHCVIEDHNGNVVIVDLSTNGTFLNYSKIPLGRTPTPLNTGDVLSVGPYELVVQITDDVPQADPLGLDPLGVDPVSPGAADRAPDPMALLDDAGPGGDFLDDLLGSETPTGPKQLNTADPIDELLPPMGEDEDPFFQKADDGRDTGGASMPMHNPSANDAFTPQAAQSGMIPEDWDDLLGPGGGGGGAPAAAPAVVPAGGNTASPFAGATSPIAQAAAQSAAPVTAAPVAQAVSAAPVAGGDTAPPAANPAQNAAVSSQAIASFLTQMGASDVQISDADLEPTMARMGRIMKTLITGLREILMTRTSIKSEFRIEQTMIGAGANNPLKFSISAEQAIETMVRPSTKGYLSPETATEQALDDIKAHEVAMVTGMEAALKGVLAKLDPVELEAKIETSSALGSLFKGKKARYWEVYEKMYAEISDQAENDFHDLFSREFARAYQDQLIKLKNR